MDKIEELIDLVKLIRRVHADTTIDLEKSYDEIIEAALSVRINDLQSLQTENTQVSDEEVAKLFHDEYEKLSIEIGWDTQESCKVDFNDLPEDNKIVMIKTVKAVRNKLQQPTEVYSDFNLNRLYEWLMTENREPAKTKFTSGMLRNVADEIDFRFKQFDRDKELIECECGHIVPSDYVVSDDNGAYTCMPCQIEYMKAQTNEWEWIDFIKGVNNPNDKGLYLCLVSKSTNGKAYLTMEVKRAHFKTDGQTYFTGHPVIKYLNKNLDNTITQFKTIQNTNKDD